MHVTVVYFINKLSNFIELIFHFYCDIRAKSHVLEETYLFPLESLSNCFEAIFFSRDHN